MPESHSTGRSAPAAPLRTPQGLDPDAPVSTWQVDDVVEMGRTVIDCKHGRNTWCSCKVRDLVERMVRVGWRQE